MLYFLQLIGQNADEAAVDAAAGGIAFGMCCLYWIFIIGFYVYMALALQTIAKKLGATDKSWWAWIPIMNVLLMLELANKELWWLVLLFIPIVNIVISVIVWMAIAEARGKPSWWGIMMIVPVMNIIAPGYIAWSE